MTDKRCTHITRLRDGTEVECSSPGGWTLDKTERTWRPAQPADKARRCWAHGPGEEHKPYGRGGRRKVQPNAKLQRIAGLVLGSSLEVTKALMEISDELSMLGFPSSSNRGVTVQVDEDGDPVGGDVVRSHELAVWREDLRDAINDLGNRTDTLVRLLHRIRGVRYAHGVRLCAENQQGRQGSIEWGEPTCTELPTKANLCATCYQAERRWRLEHGVPTSEEPAA